MAKNLKKFAQHTDYEAFTGTTYLKPNVSYCQDVKDVHYNPKPPLCLTFEAIESGTFTFSGNSIDYSLDNGATWTTLASNTSSPTVAAGDKIMWKGEIVPASSKGVGRFRSSGQFNVLGNPMSLLYGLDINNKSSLSGKNYAFYGLFSGCTRLVSAENLKLEKISEVSNYCYAYMFYNCTNLITPPQLPATTVSNYCYSYMFYNCTSLITPPQLPATTLAPSCYYYMFNRCTSLTVVPILSATTLADSCYTYMFGNCTTITSVPRMSADAGNTLLYIPGMFEGCTSISSVGQMTLGSNSSVNLKRMFSGCTSLSDASNITIICPKINAVYMFYGCTSLQVSPVINGTFAHCDGVVWQGASETGGWHMFDGCNALRQITYLGSALGGYSEDEMTLTRYYHYSYYWVYNVASTGTFIKKAGVTITYEGSSACGQNTIPCNWTIVEQ